eukprot:11998209-Alexandrium_andersonii.AAC.1
MKQTPGEAAMKQTPNLDCHDWDMRGEVNGEGEQPKGISKGGTCERTSNFRKEVEHARVKRPVMNANPANTKRGTPGRPATNHK